MPAATFLSMASAAARALSSSTATKALSTGLHAAIWRSAWSINLARRHPPFAHHPGQPCDRLLPKVHDVDRTGRRTRHNRCRTAAHAGFGFDQLRRPGGGLGAGSLSAMASSSDDDQDPDIEDSLDDDGEEEDGEITRPMAPSGWKEKLIGPGGRSAGPGSGQSRGLHQEGDRYGSTSESDGSPSPPAERHYCSASSSMWWRPTTRPI